MSVSYRIVSKGGSRSFDAAHVFLDLADPAGEGLVFIGAEAGSAYQEAGDLSGRPFVAIELDDECLAVHAGEDSGNVLGFARFRMGKADPTSLIELVKHAGTAQSAIDAAKAAFEAAGLKVAVCGDFPGRIVNRLIRPYLNAALRRLDEGLASAQDMDKTLCLGLGYPEGPIALLERTGLAEHYDVTQSLYLGLGQEAYAPARRAQVAKARALRAPQWSGR